VIRSMLDTDFYKFLMSQFAWRYYPNTRVTMRLMSRKGLPFDPSLKDKVQNAVGKVMPTLTYSEADHLVSLGLSKKWASDLLEERLTQPRVHDDGVTVEGPWWTTMLWETHIMSAVSEVLSNGVDPTVARERLAVKHALLKMLPMPVVDFGTRRRASLVWHREVLAVMRDVLQGTSNVMLAREFGMPVVGTMAHEIFMVPTALVDSSEVAMRAMPCVVLAQWREMYGDSYKTALTDTFGTRSFFSCMDGEDLKHWSFRQDSGDPDQWVNLVHAEYQFRRLPKPTMVFSDGLTIPKMLDLKKHNGLFGWGTDLTNDTGVPAPDFVMKVVEADGHRTVKLSDDPAKSLGTPEDVARYRRVFR